MATSDGDLSETLSRDEKALILLWLARLLAGAMFLFWGAFFLEHLWEWFLKPMPQTPPSKVWFSQFLHFTLLVSYLVAMKWKAVGGTLIILTAVMFFVRIGFALTASTTIYVGLSILPGILFLAAWWLARNGPKATNRNFTPSEPVR